MILRCLPRASLRDSPDPLSPYGVRSRYGGDRFRDLKAIVLFMEWIPDEWIGDVYLPLDLILGT